MGFFDSPIGGGLVGTGLGLLLQGHNDRRQLEQQRKLTDMQSWYQKDMAKFAQGLQLDMWNKTNYGAQMEHLRKAGLNPGLLYGMGGAGGATTGGGSPSIGGANAPAGGGEAIGMMMGGAQLALLKAQKENIEADTNLKEVNATKTGGVDTENVKADTANKILDGVIKEFTGKEVKAQFEDVKNPNRGIEAKTYQDELEARQGIAGTIYELWVEGKLKDKSVAEIEQILLSNSKTREETRKIYKDMELLEENIKGAKLDNIIREIETRLQQETGIDRNSPTWLKILGRMFGDLLSPNKLR